MLITVGAAFDYHTGSIKYAPRWIQESGFEWLFRLILEPKRLWRRYLDIIPKFIYFITLDIAQFILIKTNLIKKRKYV
jgi:N-acetylglucosaminyldiphosphoundecaprenol N-acetyl-beta-D-mannosaminyltransferase